MGSAAEPGVVPRCCEELCKCLHTLDGKGGTSWCLKASYLQIYREVLHDLLSGSSLEAAGAAGRDHKKDVKIRRLPKEGIVVDNLVEVTLDDPAQLTALIEQGNKKRATSATLMNAASSRSHAVVILNLTRTEAVRAHARTRERPRTSGACLRA